MEDRENITMAHISPVQINDPLPDDWSNTFDDIRADVDTRHHKRGAFVSSIAVFQYVPEADGITRRGDRIVVPEHFYIHLICNSATNPQGEEWNNQIHGVQQGGRILSELVEATALLNGVNVMLSPATQHAASVWQRNGYTLMSDGMMIKELVN